MTASVFISAANADYSAARVVYRFLTEHGRECFFCDESLLRVGERKYRATVDRALAAAERVVVVTGNAARTESEWVKYAWQSFASGTVTGGRRGSVITVLCDGMDGADLPGALRRGQGVRFPDQLDDLPRLLDGGNAGPDKRTAPAETGRRTRGFLTIITACNVLILGVMIWLFQRHGLAALIDGAPPVPPAVQGALEKPPAGRSPVRDEVARRPEREKPGLAAPADPAGSIAAASDDAAASVAGDVTTSRAGVRAKSLSDKPEAGTALLFNPGDGGRTDFCFIPHGTFVMGSPRKEAGRGDDEAQHSVTISNDFWLARYECTQSMWESVMGSNPSTHKGKQLPVETVSWEEVAGGSDSFLAKMNGRRLLPDGWRFALPTEAQWEYACRAGTTTPFSFGSVLDGRKANCDGFLPCGTTEPGIRAGRTTPVGSYLPNAWGLGDMHGNVWEWCADTYAPNPGDGPDPLITSGTSRVQRGGSWRFNAALCRSASRQGVNPEFGDDTLGFRLAIVSNP